MSNDGGRKREEDLIAAFVDRLFGDVTSMSDEEVNEVFHDLAPDTDTARKIHELAESVAQQFRLRQQLPPVHIQAALEATKPLRDLETAKPTRMREVIERALTPSLGPASHVSFAYHKKTEITDGDKTILEDLSEELREDWKDKQE